MILRNARHEDVPAGAHLLVDDEFGRGREGASEVAPGYYDAFEEMAREPNNRPLVAERGGEIIGILQLTLIRGLSYRGGRRAQIEPVRGARYCRGAGLGREKVLAAIDLARQRICRLVQLTTDKRRKDTLRFFQRLGFVASHDGMKLMLD